MRPKSSTRKTKARAKAPAPTQQLPRWAQIAPANLPDPRVSRKSSEYGKRFVPGALGVDDEGQLWEIDTDYNARKIGRPPSR